MDLKRLEELQIEISYKNEDEEKARRAFGVIYKEYSRYLFGVIAKNLEQLNIYDRHLLTTVVDNSFVTFYEKPLKFEIPEGSNNDKPFKGWLGKVAINELRNLLSESSKTKTTNVGIDSIDHSDLFEDDLSLANLEESINMKNLRGALSSIKERDRGILLMLFMYYEEGKKTPSEVLNMICNTYETTAANVRQIKKRSMAKIINYLEQVSGQKPS